jgi:hypothetical protein
MIDRIFSAVLTFSILIGATLAFGAEVFGTEPRVTATAPVALREVQLERVVVIAKRAPAATHMASTETGSTLAQ